MLVVGALLNRAKGIQRTEPRYYSPSHDLANTPPRGFQYKITQ